MPITSILGMKMHIVLSDGKIVEMRPASQFDNGQVIDGTSRRVEEGKKMVAYQKPSSDLEENMLISKGKMK